MAVAMDRLSPGFALAIRAWARNDARKVAVIHRVVVDGDSVGVAARALMLHEFVARRWVDEFKAVMATAAEAEGVDVRTLVRCEADDIN